ncbi:LysR family transcriptional regulator [Ignatzschineria indica]|uniref:LysR family transcriptional regulator n=1 Tax=Ignatzschineria indica TaxID=472583 RepID=UPI002578B8C0|nr:LysR family transcriptional regulator [Ignatzschineria indica]MDM1545405.1 LysR family transcriptional regulator [Ignatzschineria indica]
MDYIRRSVALLKELRFFIMNNKHIRVYNYLYYFYIVAGQGSFSRAAEKLHLTQGAISKQIKSLEDILGVKLLKRKSRGVSLTTNGAYFLEKISPFIEKLPYVINQMQRSITTDVVRIICTEAVAHYWLAPLVYKFNEFYPDISIHIISNNHISVLEIEKYDFGILFGDGDWVNLEARELFPEIVCPICHKDYPTDDIQELNDLMHHRLIQLDPIQWPWLNWRDWMKSHGEIYNPTKEVYIYNQATLALASCTNKQGIALGWEFMIKDLVESGILKKIDRFETKTGKSDFLVKSKGRLSSRPAQIFHDWLLTTIK